MNRLDLLWKGAIEDFFPSFLRFFFPLQYPKIDLSKGYTFLDKELNKIYSKSKTKNRRADSLVKVTMKSGKSTYLLIHIEVQGYEDEDFDLRMFETYIRIHEKINLPIKAIAIYVDSKANYHPKQYHVADEGWGTELTYKFKTYKLFNQKIDLLENSENPFGILLATAWYAIYKNLPKGDENLLKMKVHLFRKLLEKGYNKPKIARLMEFIKRYVRFKKQEFYTKFDTDIQIITKKESPMGIIEAILYSTKQEGIEQGIEQGIKRVLKKGHSVKAVADMFDVEIDYVEKVKKTINNSSI